jgi:hypothetical protein
MKILTTLLFVFAALVPLQAAEYGKVADIIQAEGEFLTTDGSSYFLFKKDGSFDSGPLSMSGREIQGRWKPEGDYQFVIEGRWGWMNGLSAVNDRRKLVLNIQPPFSLQAEGSDNPFIPRSGKSAPKIYRCYVTIEELVKLP